mgnify:CR=1 FL=1
MGERTVEVVDVILSVERAEDPAAWTAAAARKLRVKRERITEVRLRKKSIDARKHPVKLQLRLEVGLDGKLPAQILPTVSYPAVSDGAIYLRTHESLWCIGRSAGGK